VGRPDWLPPWLIVGLGLLVLLIAVAHLRSEVAELGRVVLPVAAFQLAAVPAVGLIYAGWWLRATEFAPPDRWRIAGWCYGGSTALLALQGFTVVVRVLEGRPVAEPTFVVLVNAGIGGVVGLLVGVRTAALARRERELERRTDRLDSFASVVSHDLRNPLNVAQGRLELARAVAADAGDGDTGDGDGNGDADDGRAAELRSHLDAAADSLDRMATLIDDLLVLARADEPAGESEPVSLSDVATRAWANVPTGSARLTVADDLAMLADESRLRQLFENLFRNSVEHGSTGGDDPAVTVTVGRLSDRSGFYVADDGPGIPPDERARAFEAGYSTADDGTGFGLAIVAEIAAAHGWEVAVTDAADGGARFEISGVRTDESAGGERAKAEATE